MRYAVVHFADGRTAEAHPGANGTIELGPLGTDVARVELVGEVEAMAQPEPPEPAVEVAHVLNTDYPAETTVVIHVPPSSPLARAAYEQRAKPARKGKP
jgi:hypothetical protein